MLTTKQEPLNLIEYCSHIATVDKTFVTCIQAGQYTEDWFCTENESREHMTDDQYVNTFKEFVLNERRGRKRLTLLN